MKYNVFLSQNLRLRLTCVWSPIRDGSWKKPSVYRKAACHSYCFLWPLFSLWSSISLSDYRLAVFCYYSTSIYPVSNFYLFLNEQNFMYLVDCRCVKRRAVLHKIYIPLFGFNDVHQKEASLTSCTAGCRSCPNWNQNFKTRILPPFYSLIRRL